jgi:hypothetical protein
MKTTASLCVAGIWLGLVAAAAAQPSWIWIEGENPAEAKVTRHPWWYDQVKKQEFSGGDFISNWSDQRIGEAVYRFNAPKAGDYHFWVRANPVQSKLGYSLNGAAAKPLEMNGQQTGNINVAADGKPDLRFIAWINPGKVTLKSGANELRFLMESENNHHGIIDCFVLSSEPFKPMGTAKPDEMQKLLSDLASANKGWTVWNPQRDEFHPSPIDLRALNEKSAGKNGRVTVRDGRFVLGSGEPVRFWAVNGPPESLGSTELSRCARMLAKHGVNMVRMHGSVFDSKTGEFKPAAAARFHEVVAAMKAEGIYTHLSIYFPLWFTPQPGLPFLNGYDGTAHPFASIYFNPDFRKIYQDWWRRILTTPGPGGKTLLEEPALMSVELVNEDSYFFWTFNEKNLPPPQLEMLETQFASWAAEKHGGIEAAYKAWKGMKLPLDSAGRLAFRPLYQMFTERKPRDRDTAEFLFLSQRGFYQEMAGYLKNLGFKGLITASNWTTANNDIFGPLERASYTPGDFIDRHGYWAGSHQGDNAAWSIREGHVYSHRSALGFDPEAPGKEREFNHPAFDIKINGMPSMLSETTFNRPNRFRTEGPLFFAAYGALQGSDCITHFALDGADWNVKPGFFMQPWTLMSPAMMGQFPAAALIYRLGMIDEGDLMADFTLPLADAIALKGSPLSQKANLDELRKTDLHGMPDGSARSGIDPRIHLVGRTRLNLTENPALPEFRDPAPFIDEKTQTVTSSNRQLVLDYGKRLLRIDSPMAQGVVGNLKAAGNVKLSQLTISSDLDLGAVVVVSLDGKPLESSSRMLLQAMSEERPSDFADAPAGKGLFRITRLGRDPWLIRELQADVSLLRPDAKSLKVTALDPNGVPTESRGFSNNISLRPDSVYHLIESGDTR